ncbi:MAG: hypothetical protein IID45_13000, partial [Planctomycetes bacterium]|nr:hypothetical protein [Planctomycetota bacterium]
MRNRMAWLVAVGNFTVFAAGLMLGAATIPGCSGKSSSTDSGGSKSASRRRFGNSGPQADGGNVGTGRVTRNQRREPVNGSSASQVWFPNALTVANDERLVGTTETGKTNTSGGDEKVVANKKKSGTSADAAGDWKSLAPIAVLEAETKRIRNAITAKMQTLGVYNSAYKEIRSNGATLAAVAHIVSLHPDSLSWKADAEYVRDLGTKLHEAADGLSGKKYKATRIPFEAFIDILNRSKPKGLPKPEEGMTFSKCADRGGLMKRMDAAHKFLEKEIRKKKTFEAEAEKINHEATILATLSKVISDASYESTDEAEYKKYAQEMIKASLEMVAAVKTKNFEGYRTA